MNVFRNVVLPMAMVIASARGVAAQEQRPAGTELAIATGLSALPDAFASQCGMGGGGDAGAELGVAALYHLGHHLAVEADSRIINALHFIGGCKAMLPAVYTGYDQSLRRDPLATSTVRLAIEASAPFTTLRLTAGPGLVWGSPALPAGVLSLAASTRGRGVRFFAEFERLQTRVHAREVHTGISGPPYTVPLVLHPTIQTLRLGVAWHGRG